MVYLLSAGGLTAAVLAGLVLYYRFRARTAEQLARASGDNAAAAEVESTARSNAEDQRNAALVGDWKTRMGTAKEDKDAKEAVTEFGAAVERVRR